MNDGRLVRALALGSVLAVGAALGLMVYVLLLAQKENIQLRNVDETLGLLQQNLSTFDIVALENISQVLYGADYVTGLKVVTGSGFVVFDERKETRGDVRTYEFSEPRGDDTLRHVGTITIEVNHDPNAIRNIALSCLTGGLLSFLLMRLMLSTRSLRRELGVREASEAALREQEGNLRILLNSLTEAVIATDSVGRVSQMNPVAEQLTGWPLVAAQGKPVSSVFHIVDRNTRAPLGTPKVAEVAPESVVEPNENVTLISRTGEEYLIAQSVAPMIGGENHLSGLVIVFRDVTAELLAQQRIREMEKMQAIGVLAGGIAHDYNNLLGIISAAAEVISLKDKGSLTPSSASLLNTIVQTTRRGADLTSRLLAVGHRVVDQPKLFSLHAAIENVITLLKRTIDKRFDIEARLNATNDKILGDAALIENALLNIGLNASQAMKGDGGRFEILTEDVNLGPGDDAVRIHHAPVGPCVKVTLRDDGVGIPAESLNRIFEPFFTNRRGGGGFGLGLWAVYNTVSDHQGTIHVESQVGVETSFVIYLPVSTELIEPSADGQPVGAPTNKTILIVDDEDDMRATLAAMLKAQGCHPLEAADGEEAIRIVREDHASIDAIMMDLNMPLMSGEDAITEILTIAPTIPIIISSGYAASSKFAAGKYAGRFLFLKKPYLRADLAATLAKLFEKDPAGRT